MSASLNDSGEFLFSPKTMERITEAEHRREYTLARIKIEHPDKIREVLHLRAQWLSIKKIARLCNLAVETVVAICGEYAAELKDAHERRVQQLRSAADQLVEEILANPNNVPWSVKVPAACQLYEKAELLSGRMTQRIEHVRTEDIFSSFPDFIRSLEERSDRSIEEENVEEQNPVRPLDAINAAEMRFPGEKNAVENPPLALPEGDPENP